MKVEITKNPRDAKGLVIVVDVLRATTTMSYASGRGAEKIIVVGDLKEALKLKEDNPDYVLIGERHGIPPKGFDYGNSPSQISKANLSGKTIIMTSTSGTKALVDTVNTGNASEVLLGNFVNASKISNYIKSKNPQLVTILPAGGVEDYKCADYLKSQILGTKSNFESIKDEIKNSQSAKLFLLPDSSKEEIAKKLNLNPEKVKANLPKEDLELSLDLNRFDDFYVKVEGKYEGKYPMIKKMN